MKKTIVLVLCSIIIIAVSASAFASEVSVGKTGFVITIPSGYDQEELTRDDIKDGMVAYWSSSHIDIAVYAEDSDGYTLAELMDEISEDDEITECGMVKGGIAGVPFGYFSYVERDGRDVYYVDAYNTVYNGQIVEFYFYMDKESYSKNAAEIIATLSTGRNAAVPQNNTIVSGSAVQIGTTGLSITLPRGYTVEKLTEEDIADDVAACWTTDKLDITLWIYESDWQSVEEILADLQSDEELAETGMTMMPNGQIFAYYVYNDSGYIEISYITLYNDETIELGFLMEEDNMYDASAEAAEIMNSLK